MSYDFTVYAADHIGADGLNALVESIPGLSVGDGGGGEISVLRGKRRNYSFTVFGPHRIEPEDLPDDVVPLVLDPTTSWQVIVEGSTPTEIAPACRFAKALAHAARGVAVDEQTEDVLGAKKSRQIPRPTTEFVRLLELEWYSPASAPPAPALWLELAKKLFPEALPRRYGGYEPYPYRLDRDGEGPFITEFGRFGERYESQTFLASSPCRSGGLFAPPWGGYLLDRLQMLAAPLDDPRWRNTVRRFFVTYARRRGSVLAVAEVLRNHRLSGPPDPGRDQHGSLRAADGILGLPANPVWLTWLGNDYLPLVGAHLPPEHTTYYPEGALYAPTDEPTDRGQLAALPDPIPAQLRVTAIPSPYGPANTPKNDPAPIRLQGDECEVPADQTGD
ncbi:hypothetical protein [Mycolicibacter sinensis]|uniref:Uncharacterized protein n=1 Tax=Mycolicibacter sinensis (strain JDM601) TaxID=875328 RepID=A0A1A2Y962_MYCSD|nr:hypothetical protein [Mycolicibacter sinensis]OBH20924.1 hypothetical protein A5694_14670 [Mycolicibacter sinensis]OBI33611.1 hypothetical protein A5710_13300 [Mycolicibacter sinensis]